MRHTTLALAAATFLTSASAQEEPTAPQWHADFDVAAQQAKKAGKNLLVDFTGSDWCHWCVRLDNEVFAHEAFLDPATKDYVLVALDYPRTKAAMEKVPNPARNEELKTKYGIRGFPTVILMTPAGEVLGQTGYQAGGPGNYVRHLAEISQRGKAAIEATAKLANAIAKSDGDKKLDLYFKAVEQLAVMTEGAAGRTTLATLAREAMAADPQNGKGLRLAAVRGLMKAGAVDPAILDAAKTLDPKNRDGLFEQAVASVCRSVTSREQVSAAIAQLQQLHGLDIRNQTLGAEIFTNGALWADRFLMDKESAVRFAKKALELGASPQSKRMLEDIVGG